MNATPMATATALEIAPLWQALAGVAPPGIKKKQDVTH